MPSVEAVYSPVRRHHTKVSNNHELRKIKIVFTGDRKTGKTTLANLLAQQNFSTLAKHERNFVSAGVTSSDVETIGVNLVSFVVTRENLPDRLKSKDYQINIWDLCGEQHYHEIRQEFYKENNDSVCIFCDNEKRDTIRNLGKWYEEVISGGFEADKIHVVRLNGRENQTLDWAEMRNIPVIDVAVNEGNAKKFLQHLLQSQ